MDINNKALLIEYAEKYDKKASVKDKMIEAELKKILFNRRYLNIDELIKIGHWKAPRIVRHCKNNDPEAVIEITKFSLSAKTEQARISSLLGLNGVSWPMASVILHFAFPEQYPVLDFRVLWSIGWGKPPASYTFQYWKKYFIYIREISKNVGLDIRTVDKALWQYSKENQD
ncbi:MAG: Uncharacterized protein G01um10143_755 [Parcubacteria group bacterium Gr01-1014_3]|nr:MAG: Uncharacterized protein G01um10143_755 [Parcubacteria group bacterium Gr01-1014_3]